jgi:hypothetical protein
VTGEISVPGAGLTTAPAWAPGGNQLTSTGFGRLSHVRGAAATSIEPAGPTCASVMSLCVRS